jgi:hypothetical protein
VMVTERALLAAGERPAGVAPPSNTDVAREEYPDDEKFPIVDDVFVDDMDVCLAAPRGGAAAPNRERLLMLLLMLLLTELMPDMPLTL